MLQSQSRLVIRKMLVGERNTEMKHSTLTLFVVLAHLSHITKSSGQLLPLITYEDLTNGIFEHAKTSFGSVEVFGVTNLPESYQSSLDLLIKEGPECLTKSDDDHQLPTMWMQDGSSRTTYATQDSTFPACLPMMKGLVEAFDLVESAVTRLIQQEYNDEENSLAYLVGSEKVPLSQAPHKDHVHVYRNNASSSSTNKNMMVPYHTDNGLFLILTPFPDAGLMVQLSDGTEVQTSDLLPSNSILVLMGRGLTDWLLQEGGYPESSTAFDPVKHAVPALGSVIRQRTVYARMKVAPEFAIPGALVRKPGTDRVKDLKTFGDIFMETRRSPDELCSVNIYKSMMNRARHQAVDKEEAWFEAMDMLCDKGTAYCWMGCREVPQNCQPFDQHRSDLTCRNDKTNFTCRGQEGGPGKMDPGCRWHCENHPSPLKSDFCNGAAADMLMTGFETAGTNPSNPCVILFIKSWTLDTRTKFGLACVGVAALGFAVEAIIALRRKLSSPRRLSPYLSAPPSIKRVVSVALFGLNLTLGYLAMLVAMTYSFELFLCVVLGLMAGHAFFNVRQRVGETIDPCCAGNNDQAYLVESGGSGGGGCPASSTPTVMGPVTRTPSCSGPCSSESQTRPIIRRSSQDSPPPYLCHQKQESPQASDQPSSPAQQSSCCKDSESVLT